MHFYRRPFAYIPVPVWDPVRPILNQSSQERVWESTGLEFLPGKPAKNPRKHKYFRFNLETWICKSRSNISVASDTEWLSLLNIYIFKILLRNILRFTNETANKNDNVYIILNKHTVAQKGIWTPNPLIKYLYAKTIHTPQNEDKGYPFCLLHATGTCSTNFIHALKTWIKCKYREAEIDWIDENTELYCCYLTADIWKLLLFDCF